MGGFAVSSADNPLHIEDFVTVHQLTTAVSVEFDDQAVADYFDTAVDAGLVPARFARVWCHTHPGESADPSMTDEVTFARVFGSCDWSVMFILGRTGRTYARLNFSAGPGGAVLLPVTVDWEAWPQVVLERAEELAEVFAGWAAEFERHIHPMQTASSTTAVTLFPRLAGEDWWGLEELHEEHALGEDLEEQVLQLFEAGEGVVG